MTSQRRMPETHNAGAGQGRTLHHDFIAPGPDAVLDLLRSGIDGSRHVFNPDLQQELKRGPVAETANGIQSAAFIAPCIGAQRHIAGTVVRVVGWIGPAELYRFNSIQPLLPDV